MTAVAAETQSQDIAALMGRIGADAKAAAAELAGASAQAKNRALSAAADHMRDQAGSILAANGMDMAAGRDKGLSSSMLDRLALDESRIETMAAGLEAITALDDPVRRVIAEWERPNGLRITRVAVPLGVVGIIYESRPNVTAGRGFVVPEGGQRRHPAWRLGKLPLVRSHHGFAGRRPGGGRPAPGLHPAGADPRPGHRRPYAEYDGVHRHYRAPGRQVADRAYQRRQQGAAV